MYRFVFDFSSELIVELYRCNLFMIFLPCSLLVRHQCFTYNLLLSWFVSISSFFYFNWIILYCKVPWNVSFLWRDYRHFVHKNLIILHLCHILLFASWLLFHLLVPTFWYLIFSYSRFLPPFYMGGLPLIASVSLSFYLSPR